MKDAPVDLDRLISTGLVPESVLGTLLKRVGLDFIESTIFKVEFVLEDLRLGGGGGTTGT